ncbi:hypothetical protein PBY51_024866 [Eleginops maclovinus]|uniref:Uncharacterized protein n=1 Tax=Eleginops maclovinus TaxID=56733 RepID=A0AAN7Y2A5_ELEMC|nr:hypothetical protein PBY51_024866 [Eleginops maclovinus]
MPCWESSWCLNEVLVAMRCHIVPGLAFLLSGTQTEQLILLSEPVQCLQFWQVQGPWPGRANPAAPHRAALFQPIAPFCSEERLPRSTTTSLLPTSHTILVGRHC